MVCFRPSLLQRYQASGSTYPFMMEGNIEVVMRLR
jgi:hypothetical protein